jgi:serine/threonine protein kinase
MSKLNEWIDAKIKDGDIIYFDYDEFSNVKKVGEGAFGCVNKAYWKSGGIKIALKILAKTSSINKDNMDMFFKEVTLRISYSIQFLLCRNLEY